MDDEEIELPQSKQCLCCKQIKAIEQFKAYAKGLDGYYPLCKSCETRKRYINAAGRRPSERKRYARGLMARLHLTGKDY